RTPPCSTLFPYTTLFRSCGSNPGNLPAGISTVLGNFGSGNRHCGPARLSSRLVHCFPREGEIPLAGARYGAVLDQLSPAGIRLRSEEHTSELQSPYDLVC